MFIDFLMLSFKSSDYVRKSIGNEQTFREIHKPQDLHEKCEELCDELIKDLQSHNMVVCIYLYISLF